MLACPDYFLIDSGYGNGGVEQMLARVKDPELETGTIVAAKNLKGVLLTHSDLDHVAGIVKLVKTKRFQDATCPLYLQRAFRFATSTKLAWTTLVNDQVKETSSQSRWQFKNVLNADGTVAHAGHTMEAYNVWQYKVGVKEAENFLPLTLCFQQQYQGQSVVLACTNTIKSNPAAGVEYDGFNNQGKTLGAEYMNALDAECKVVKTAIDKATNAKEKGTLAVRLGQLEKHITFLKGKGNFDYKPKGKSPWSGKPSNRASITSLLHIPVHDANNGTVTERVSMFWTGDGEGGYLLERLKELHTAYPLERVMFIKVR